MKKVEIAVLPADQFGDQPADTIYINIRYLKQINVPINQIPSRAVSLYYLCLSLKSDLLLPRS